MSEEKSGSPWVKKNSNKSISNLIEALATRPEGWTCRILKDDFVQHDLEQPQEESGSPCQVSRRISPSAFRYPRENFFGMTFRSFSAVPIYDFSVHMTLTIYTTNNATVRIHWMTKHLASWAINPFDDNTWCAIMCTFCPEVTAQNTIFFFWSSLLAFFVHTGMALFRFNGTPWTFLTSLCLLSPAFFTNLSLINFCLQRRLRGNHCLCSPSFCTVCPLRRWRR